jgi:hypothetical protein
LCLLRIDAGDLDTGQLLAVALALLVSGLVLELLDDDFRTALVSEHLRNNLDLGEGLGFVGDLVTINEEHRDKLDIAVFVGLDTVEYDDRADLRAWVKRR